MVGSALTLDLPRPSFGSTVEIAFKDITYSVKASYNVFSTRRKNILGGVSGHFVGGELTAIMGPSGAGKSTLINILSGYRDKGFLGEVRLSSGGSRSCYIMQEENLHPLLTVEEVMSLAARLKLAPSVNSKQRQIRISEILQSLGLSGNYQNLTGSLSGGQRKRLSIALELIDNPKIMFFDEPTSGLDSSSAKQCVRLLKELAREGRAVVCSIHQPTAGIFTSLDHVYCIASGRCTFTGSPSAFTTFLTHFRLEIPAYHNPADFMIEVCNGDYGDHFSAMVELCQNGKSHQWRNPNRKQDDLTSSDLSKADCVGTPVHAPLLLPLQVTPADLCYPASFLIQVMVLVRRNTITLVRDRFLMHSRLIIHAMIGVLIGIFFYNVGMDAGMVFSNFNLLFFSILFLSFSALQSTTISFPLEMPIIRKEHFNSWYSVKAYFMANIIADFPVQVACAVIYCSLVYWMSGQPSEWIRFFMFTFISTLTSLLAQTIGYLVGASLNVMNGVMFGPMSITPWVMFSGFFLQARDSPDWSKWIFTVSWLRRGIEGVTTAVYGYSRSPLPCISEDYCHFVSPLKFLKELDMADYSFGYNVCFIFLLYSALKLATYFVLVYQLKKKR